MKLFFWGLLLLFWGEQGFPQMRTQVGVQALRPASCQTHDNLSQQLQLLPSLPGNLIGARLVNNHLLLHFEYSRMGAFRHLLAHKDLGPDLRFGTADDGPLVPVWVGGSFPLYFQISELGQVAFVLGNPREYRSTPSFVLLTCHYTQCSGNLTPIDVLYYGPHPISPTSAVISEGTYSSLRWRLNELLYSRKMLLGNYTHILKYDTFSGSTQELVRHQTGGAIDSYHISSVAPNGAPFYNLVRTDTGHRLIGAEYYWQSSPHFIENLNPGEQLVSHTDFNRWGLYSFNGAFVAGEEHVFFSRREGQPRIQTPYRTVYNGDKFFKTSLDGFMQARPVHPTNDGWDQTSILPSYHPRIGSTVLAVQAVNHSGGSRIDLYSHGPGGYSPFRRVSARSGRSLELMAYSGENVLYMRRSGLIREIYLGRCE